MTLKHLKIFLSVAKHENITRAAEELFMTQPAVSLAIAQLEENYQVKLFDRAKQRIKLTEHGKELLQYANSIINNFEEFENLAYNKAKKVIVKLGTSLSIGEKLLPSMLKDYENKDNITFSIAPSDKIIELVLSGNLDLGLIETNDIDSRLTVINLTKDSLILVASKNYPVPSEIKVEDLIQYPLLLRNSGTGVRNTFDNLIKSRNIIIKPKVESMSNLSLLEFAKKGYGIAILPSLIYNELNNELKIIKIKNVDLIRQISLVYKNNKLLSSDELSLISFIKNYSFNELK